jgi:hypothetical protein
MSAMALQVPLHAGAPSSSGPLRGASLDDIPRLPCASLLLRILTPGGAQQLHLLVLVPLLLQLGHVPALRRAG